jgi:hypothetical protein
MAKKWTGRLVLAATIGAAMVALSSAPAAAACPAPGTGLPGALNMVAAGAGMDLAMSVDAPQGNAGMATAVGNSGCSDTPRGPDQRATKDSAGRT